VVKGLLGDKYAGVIVCDYFSAYRKCWEDMEHIAMQFCWSHLIRDLKFLLTLPAVIAQKYGERVLKVVRQMFDLWHRRSDLGERYYKRAMRRAKARLLKAAKSKSNHSEVRKLATRLTSRYADSYFTFMDYRGVDPTNNRTEQQIRFVGPKPVSSGANASGQPLPPVGNATNNSITSSSNLSKQRSVSDAASLRSSIDQRVNTYDA